MATDPRLIFPSSQVLEGAPARKIFCHPSGLPMEIFVDAGVVSSRPKLMRTLRKWGANICKGVALAQIILVDATSTSGRQFIRDWGQSKIVLEYLWARKCVDANKALMESDDWGGCGTFDDGRPILTDEGADYEDSKDSKPKSPLPTPRPSPPEPGSLSQNRYPNTSRTSSSAPTRPVTSRSEYIPEPPVENGHSNTSSHGTPAQNYVRSHSTPSFNPNLGSVQPVPQSQPINGNLTQHFPQSQPIENSSTRHYTQSQPVNNNPTQHFPLSQVANGNPIQHFSQSQPTTSNLMHHFPQSLPASNNSMQNFSQHQPLQAPQFSQPPHINSMPNFSQSQHNLGNMMTPQGFLNAMGPTDGQNIMQSIFDVMRHRGINPMNAQAMFGSMFMGPQEQFFPTMSQHPTFYSQPQMDGMTQPPEQQSLNSIDSDSNVISKASVRSPTVESNLQPSQIHNSSPLVLDRSSPSPSPSPSPSSSANSPPPSRSKGKRKAVLPAYSRDQKSVTVSPSITSTPSKAHPRVGSPRPLGKIFITKSGEPLSFFVQVDLRPRLPVITKIKKNGGVLDSSHISADYAILYRNSTSFNALLKSRVTAEKPALSSAYVDDCVEEEALLDPTTYLFQGSVSTKRKRGGLSTSPSAAEKAQRRKEEAERKKQNKRKKETKEGAGRVKIEEEDTSPYRGPPSPSPPPENTKVLWREGHYSFSEPERAYMSRYVRFLVERDPSISNTAISLALHRKMRHHSARSWASFIWQSARDEIETIRKKVGIARRKAESVTAQAQQQPSDHHEAGPSKKPKLSSPHHVQDPNFEQQDLECICRFFAMGGDDGGDDEHVWSLLATHQECKTAATWPDFYENHQVEVMAGITKLCGAAETAEALSAGPSANALRPKMEMVVWT